VHVYRMTLEKNDQSIRYATIVETHHPDYMTEAQLLELYAVNREQQSSPADVDSLLGIVVKSEASVSF